MTLAAAQVKAAVVSRLVAAATSAASRVYLGRGWPFAESELPAILVVPGEVDIDSDDVTWPELQEHRLPLAIKARLRDMSDPDAAMDALAEQIFGALQGTEAHARLSPLAGCRVFARGYGGVIDTAGEAAVAELTVNVEVAFQTAANDPSTLI